MHGLIRDFSPIAKPTVLKSKILQIWNYAISNQLSVPKNIYNISVKQLGAYKDVCKQEREFKVSDAATVAKLKVSWSTKMHPISSMGM